jgi:glycine cleavage system aminomethyltransferase T/glycine/D-amino acid oxidase-like deaminating enzyme
VSARCVVIGGGIVGCSVAYHLAREGWKDVVLLERDKLTSGSTWHAAGLVGQLRSNANITRLLKNSVELYERLEAETGHASGWKRNGGLRLACNADRMIEIRRQATTARSFGLEMHLLSPAEARDLWPLMDTSDLVGAAFLPTDGQANPSDITQALARGARQQGVRIVEDCPVTGFRIEQGSVTGVLTGDGEIACEAVALCAGQWSKAIGRLAGVRVPLQPVQHQYMITEPIAGVTPDLPTLRDPDRLIYLKEEVGGLVMGGYEPNPISWAEEGIPDGFAFTLLDPDWDHFEPLMEQALVRVPALETAGVKQLINGPESFTPDGNFILGEAPELQGFFVGCGFNAFGIASAGGAGRALAEWIAAGEPSMDLWPVDIRRFGLPQSDDGWVRSRTLELYGKHYTIAWPSEEHSTGRPLRRSPLYARLREAGAVFGEKLGWERANWFARPGLDEPRDIYGFGRPNWFEAVGEEHHACRERVALFDASSFAKFMLVGQDAEAALSWICANDVAQPPGRVAYTQMLNARGGIECDLTVTRLAPDAYYIVTGTGFATHDFSWIERNLPESDVRLLDVTSAFAVLPVMGPRARDLLARVSAADVSNKSFPFGNWRSIAIAGAPVRALRVTYVGELGYELHVPSELALTVYEALLAAGGELGLAHAGYRAIESLRLEKGYRAWGADIGPDHTPLEAGLGFALKLASGQPFQGREALERQRAAGLSKRLACFTVDPEVVLLGRETIYRDGRPVGWLGSGGFGYTALRGIGYGYVRQPGIDRDWLLAGQYQLEVATERVAATLHLKPLYDPGALRIRQ